MISMLFWTLTAGACFVTFAGFIGKWCWLCEVASHFRVQYFFLLALAACVLLVGQHYYHAAFVASLAIINLWCILSLYLPSPREKIASPDRQVMRMVSLNVNIDNHQRGKVLELVRQTKPDFLVLSEMSAAWDDVAQQLSHEFQESRVALRGHFGIAFFSQYPVDGFELKEFASVSIYAFIAHVRVGTHKLSIIGAHLLPPVQWGYYQTRNQHLADLAELAQQLTGPVILVGDLNVTPWSPYFHALVRDSGLYNGRQGIGVLATWPVQFPLLRIPIDHCLVSSEIEMLDMSRGVNVGSDHFPLIVEFAWYEAAVRPKKEDEP